MTLAHKLSTSLRNGLLRKLSGSTGDVLLGDGTFSNAPIFGGLVGASNLTGWVTWTSPARTGWTDVGTPTVSGRFCRLINVLYFQLMVIPATSVATVAGTSYVALPATAKPASLGGDGSMGNFTTMIAVGNCVIDVANSRVYVPAQAASANTFVVNGWYEV